LAIHAYRVVLDGDTVGFGPGTEGQHVIRARAHSANRIRLGT